MGRPASLRAWPKKATWRSAVRGRGATVASSRTRAGRCASGGGRSTRRNTAEEVRQYYYRNPGGEGEQRLMQCLSSKSTAFQKFIRAESTSCIFERQLANYLVHMCIQPSLMSGRTKVISHRRCRQDTAIPHVPSEEEGGSLARGLPRFCSCHPAGRGPARLDAWRATSGTCSALLWSALLFRALAATAAAAAAARPTTAGFESRAVVMHTGQTIAWGEGGGGGRGEEESGFVQKNCRLPSPCTFPPPIPPS